MIGHSEKWLSLLLHPHHQKEVGNKLAHILATGPDFRESLHSLHEYWLCTDNVQSSDHAQDSLASWSFIINNTQRGEERSVGYVLPQELVPAGNRSNVSQLTPRLTCLIEFQVGLN